MIQPNFLDLDWRVRRAIELVQNHPNTASSLAYGVKLQGALERFRATNTDTDATYTAWRMKRGKQMTAFRDLRLESDRTRALADEHAVDGYPTQRIVYTDEDELIAFVQSAIAFLKPRVDEWKWVQDQINKLDTGIANAATLKREEQAAFRLYTARAKERVAAYENLYALFKNYLRDAKNDHASDPQYQEIRLVYA